jgi:alpha-L-fucosidase
VEWEYLIPSSDIGIQWLYAGYNSSAWKVWGEGKVVMSHGNLGHVQAATPYTANDIRFTFNNGSLYAWLMAWPESNKVLIRSLQGPNKISSVYLLGYKNKLKWKQTAQGLEIILPTAKPCQFAYGLKISGEGLGN